LDGSLPYTCPGDASSLPYLGLSTKSTVLGSSYPPFPPSQPGGALVSGTTYDTTALVAYVYGTGGNCLPVYDTGTGFAWTAFRAEITVGDLTDCAYARGGCDGNTYAARVDQQREGSSEECAGTTILVGSVPQIVPPFEVSMDGSTLYMFLGGCEGGYQTDANPLGSSGWQVWATLTRVTPDGG
jgi:hypothetical protein